MATTLSERRMLARGISRRTARLWRNRKFLGTGTSRGVHVSSDGYTVVSRTPSGTQPRFAVQVSGANTPQSITVSGNDITFVSATNGSSAATSTPKDLVRAIQAHSGASAKIGVGLHKEGGGSSVVTARALTTLAPSP